MKSIKNVYFSLKRQKNANFKLAYTPFLKEIPMFGFTRKIIIMKLHLSTKKFRKVKSIFIQNLISYHFFFELLASTQGRAIEFSHFLLKFRK